MGSKIVLNDVVERSATYPFQQVVDEIIIVEPHAKLMHSLNEVGSAIWTRLAQPCNVQSLINHVTEEYEVNQAEAQADIIQFLEAMIKRNLIRIRGT